MRVVDRRPVFFILSIVSFYLSAFTIAFMPLGSFDDMGNRWAVPTILASVFWAGIVLGFVFTYRVYRQRRWDIRYVTPRRALPHFLYFFTNKPAAVFDFLLLAGGVTLVIDSRMFLFPVWFVWIVLFITFFSFEMHFVFNGKNYEWLTSAPPPG